MSHTTVDSNESKNISPACVIVFPEKVNQKGENLKEGNHGYGVSKDTVENEPVIVIEGVGNSTINLETGEWKNDSDNTTITIINDEKIKAILKSVADRKEMLKKLAEKEKQARVTKSENDEHSI